MADQVIIDLEKPEDLKEGTNVVINENFIDKLEIEISNLNQTEAKIGAQVDIQEETNPKTW